MSEKIARFLADNHLETPCLVVDLDVIADSYRALRRALPDAEIHYAVKANPAQEVLSLLVGLGSSFDAASRYEIDQCLAAGADPARVSYGNTIKKASDIAHAYDRGVRLFAFDSESELHKLAENAPGARVFCRILVSEAGARWPLSGKFGCEPAMARDLMVRARELGLQAHGAAFHVGSQQVDPKQWEMAIGRTAELFSALAGSGIEPRMVNLGGGFPVRYRAEVPEIDVFAETIKAAMREHFGNRPPEIIIEPGRWLTAPAGVIQSEVVLVSRKSYNDDRRWVYLDVGKFGGLAETVDEAIQYPIRAARREIPAGAVIIAGPTCDGADVLYENAGYRLPMDLRSGDRVQILNTGAYTASYSSVGFNGFPPLKAYYV